MNEAARLSEIEQQLAEIASTLQSKRSVRDPIDGGASQTEAFAKVVSVGDDVLNCYVLRSGNGHRRRGRRRCQAVPIATDAVRRRDNQLRGRERYHVRVCDLSTPDRDRGGRQSNRNLAAGLVRR